MKVIECFSGDTEVLTKNGWVKFSELKQDYAELAQYDVKTGEISFARPLNYNHQKDRETFHYEDRNTSIFATANHNVLTKWRPGQQASKNAFKDTNFSRGHAFVNAGKFENGVNDEWVARYIAMFNADGSMNEEGYVTFAFSKDRKVKRCKFILDNLGIEYSVRQYKRTYGAIDIVFYVGRRTTDIVNTYTDRSKTLKWSCIETLDIDSFVDEIQYWDSTIKEQGGVRFTTTNLETAKVTQAMLVLTNHKSTLRKDFSNYERTNGSHNKVYYLNYKPHKEETITYMSGETVDFTKPVVQDVYCATMPLGTLVIRHNDKVSMQGNCDFSQAELRVASMFANDKNMQDAYNSGSDLHSKTTELLFGDTSQLSHDEQKRKRTQAKSCFTGDTEISVCFVDEYGMKHNFDMRLDFLYNNLDEDCTLNTAWYNGKVYLKGFDTDTLKEKKTNKFSMIKQTNATVYHYEAVNYKLEFKITGNHRCFVFDDRTAKFDVVAFSNLNHHHSFVVIEKDKFVLRRFCADYITETKRNVDVYCVQSAMDNMIVKSKNSVNHIYFMNCNFGFLYGMSAKTFVQYSKGYGLNLSQEESEKLRNDFFNAYPRLPEWHDECRAFLHKHGYSYSPSGRKRFFPQVYSDNPRVVASAERGCVNAGVQGFASDLCVSALADVVFSEELDHSKFNVVGSVHDAILIEVQEDYAQELGEKVQEIMSHPSILDDLGIEIPVPLKADLSIGDAWGMEE